MATNPVDPLAPPEVAESQGDLSDDLTAQFEAEITGTAADAKEGKEGETLGAALATPGEKPAEKPAGKTAKSKGKKKKKKKGQGNAYLESFLETTKSLATLFKEAATGILSKDRLTRRMAFFFWISSLGYLGVCGMGFKYHCAATSRERQSERRIHEEKQNLSIFIKKQADDARRKAATLTLGTFWVELNSDFEGKTPFGLVNMAEIQIILECDSKETRVFLETNLVVVRDKFATLFTAMDRDEIMSREGKRSVKRKLLEKINTWLPSGKVEEIYFSKLHFS
ncbi:flagellar basal body-associated FliL family protein [Bdellovibrionota bacterium FG-2]